MDFDFHLCGFIIVQNTVLRTGLSCNQEGENLAPTKRISSKIQTTRDRGHGRGSHEANDPAEVKASVSQAGPGRPHDARVLVPSAHGAAMSAGKDAMNWEDDVDMYGGDSSTSAALFVGPETPPTNAEKKQEARRMKQQVAGDRMQRMTAYPEGKELQLSRSLSVPISRARASSLPLSLSFLSLFVCFARSFALTHSNTHTLSLSHTQERTTGLANHCG